MHTTEVPGQVARQWHPRRFGGALRRLVVVASCCAGLVTVSCGGGDSAPPQNTSIAGKWQVTCQPPNEDCPNFILTFDSGGDITEADLHGHRGSQKGFGKIADSKLAFNLGHGNVYEFSGLLNPPGSIATGTLKNFDHDGEQKTTPAIVTRK